MLLRSCCLVVSLVWLGMLAGSVAWSAELLVGGATVSITPDKPVALSGQRHVRIASEIESPVMASALAIESRQDGKPVDQAIFVACDLVAIYPEVMQRVRERVKDRLPGFDTSKLIVSATHTHTAPVTVEDSYMLPKEGIIQPAEYVVFLVDRLAEIIVEAWESKQPGAVSWGLGHAQIAYNRRPVYDDGHAEMYGKSARPDFRGLEGNEDHGVEVLFFWNAQQKLIATIINVACPAQDAEGNKGVNADFWHEAREALHKKYGQDLLVVPWTGAGGDQSPHLIYRSRAEARMEKLRGITRLEDLAQRIVQAWEEAYDGAKRDIRTDVVLAHKVADIQLTPRQFTQEESLAAKSKAAEYVDNPKEHWNYLWNQKVVNAYERQRAGTDKPIPMELHVVRLGDVAITTNPFELYTEFGIQMKARSPAIQTFVIQLANGAIGYVPTAEAARAGGYSAIPQSTPVGPEGGREMVEKTLEVINGMWVKE